MVAAPRLGPRPGRPLRLGVLLQQVRLAQPQLSAYFGWTELREDYATGTKLAPTSQVVPMLRPCDNDRGLLKDYRDDQNAADAGAVGFRRAFGKFPSWRDRQDPDNPCLKRIHVLAHSMGARVLRGALDGWAHDYGPVYGVFRNIFLVAADLVNETLDLRGPGRCLSDAARNVTVHHASDDLALRTSKVTNLRHKIVSRRLGHSGPEDLSRTAGNVYAVDCDNFIAQKNRRSRRRPPGRPDRHDHPPDPARPARRGQAGPGR